MDAPIDPKTNKPWYGSNKLMPEDMLFSERDKAQTRLQEIRDEIDRRTAWSPTYKLARKLHDNLCEHRECDWFYWDGDGIIPDNLSEPKKYFQMAQRLLDLCATHQLNEDSLIQIFSKRNK